MTNVEEAQFQQAREQLQITKRAIQSFIVGQEDALNQIIWSMFAGGHALLEGLPGVGKTMMIRTISEAMELSFSRIQFTPDLMPADITGTMMIEPNEQGKQEFTFHQGPVFSNIVLADEINRATPKTQSALLEAMGEQTVTVIGETHSLPRPFFVLATQNPVDLEGTYPLPEAQMDRFLCKINIAYPRKNELKTIIERTVTNEKKDIQALMNSLDVIAIQKLATKILVADDILDFAINLVMATHADHELAPESVRAYVRFGSGPRGLQSLIKIAKVRALMEGRYHVSVGDIKQAALPVLRHRLFLNFEGEATGISTDRLIEDVIEKVSVAETV
ncbi:AAA family ATPase [Anaerobacillus sp. CMMVII]|uniref:AAA family ATPase n=1 Tax=Anaerobacillus sp. CMMVII TaxID=2755588 RepID=UPI0021B7A616|nr:AAA family ATPase [Anaerobacillus sp. CMMVII]MCT8136505.1 AAA family ATPase [Anaerobacillus sp. CMMVII]